MTVCESRTVAFTRLHFLWRVDNNLLATFLLGYVVDWKLPSKLRKRTTAMLQDNIFLKIIERKIPAKIAYEDERCLAFHDINPQAPVHVLIIPKKVIRTHDEIADVDKDLLGHIHVVAVKLAAQLGLTDGYRLVINCKERANQTVPHLHFHLIGGRDMTWPPG